VRITSDCKERLTLFKRLSPESQNCPLIVLTSVYIKQAIIREKVGAFHAFVIKLFIESCKIRYSLGVYLQ